MKALLLRTLGPCGCIFAVAGASRASSAAPVRQALRVNGVLEHPAAGKEPAHGAPARHWREADQAPEEALAKLAVARKQSEVPRSSMPKPSREALDATQKEALEAMEEAHKQSEKVNEAKSPAEQRVFAEKAYIALKEAEAAMDKYRKELDKYNSQVDEYNAALPRGTDPYIQISSGNCTDYKGYMPIKSTARCEKAAKWLGLADMTVEETITLWAPEGCYYIVGSSSEGNRLYINTEPNNEGNGYVTDREPICQRKAFVTEEEAAHTTVPPPGSPEDPLGELVKGNAARDCRLASAAIAGVLVLIGSTCF